jgi:hypothetical protein
LRVERAQRGEERADRLRVEGEARRKLKQQRAELAAEARHLLEKCIERRVRPRQAEGVRDLLWRLDGKGETIRRGGRPALVGRSPVRPAEGHHFSQRKPRNLAALTQCLRTRPATWLRSQLSRSTLHRLL